MFAITVTEKGGEQRRLDFDKSEVTIGRVQGNDVILPKGNVSKRHARIVLKDGKFIIVDLKSTNGTYVNGRKITSPLVIKETDKIYIGDFILGVEEGAGAGAAPPEPAPPGPGPMAPPPPQPPAPSPPQPPSPVAAPSPPQPPQPPQPQPTLNSPPVPAPSPPQPATPQPTMQPAPSFQAPPPLQSSPAPSPPAPSPPAPSLPAPSPPAPSPPTTAPSASRGPANQPPLDSLGPSPAMTPSPSPAVAPPRPAPRPPAPSKPPRPARRSTGPAPAGTGGAAPAAHPRLVRAASRPSRPQAAQPGAARAPVIEPLEPKVLKLLELQRSILDRLVPKLQLDEVPVERLGDEELWERAERAIVDMVESMDSGGEVPNFIDQDQLIKETLNEALGLGPLEDLLADDGIDEIIVDRRDRILVGTNGNLSGAGKAFSSDETFRRVVERLVAPTGHLIDESQPFVDVRLRDGSRVAAAVPPVAVRGACLTLRKPRSSAFSLADLIQQGALSGEMGDFLTTCVTARKNIVVCGAPGSGKSAVLAALAAAAPEGERIVSVEEVAELALGRDDWIALESRPSDGNGMSSVDVETLLRGALRMRPDRLVVGDIRGAEALELVMAMGSSNDGTLASVSGDGARAALTRLTAMSRLAAPGSSVEALRELIACAVDVVVHVARYADGIYRVSSIDEVLAVGEDGFQTQQVFCFRGNADDGGFAAAGIIPAFYADLEARGIPADTSIFRT